MKKITIIFFFVLCMGFLLFSQKMLANTKIDNSKKFSSPAAEMNFLMHGDLSKKIDINKEVDAIFSNDGVKTYAYRSAGCSTGCSTGWSTGCSSGCSSGCSVGCSVGCSIGCSIGCQ